MTTEELIQLNSAAILQLSKKVDFIMAAIDDLKAATADLATLIDGAVSTVGVLKDAASAHSDVEAEIAAVVAQIKAMQAKIAPHIDVASVAPAPAPVVDTSVPPPPPAVVVDPVTNVVRSA